MKVSNPRKTAPYLYKVDTVFGPHYLLQEKPRALLSKRKT